MSETVVKLFTAEEPQAVAIREAGRSFTYGELRAWAVQIGASLRRASVRDGDLVAIAGESAAATIAGMIGAWAAAAAHLPLSAGDPPGRLTRILADAGPTCVLAEGDLTDRAWPVPCVALEPLRGAVSHDPSQIGSCEPTTSNKALAYVIYTSGSTGTPKGVEVGHAALDAYLAHARREYRGLDGVILLHSPLAFDLAITSVFGPLTAGGTVECVDALPELLRRQGRRPVGESDSRRFVKVTPGQVPYLTTMASVINAREPEIVIGGESLSSRDVAACRKAFPDAVITNEYGPTEATVGCSTYRLEPDDPLPDRSVPIGRPVSGTALYVLNSDGSATAKGDIGELCIGGAQVAWGYRNRPRETADRFQPDPDGAPGSRRYRSGDFVVEADDGELVFVGRQDEQVKIRGYRVELGEVREALLETGLVREAVVLAQPLARGGSDLAAFVTLREPQGDIEAVRESVADVLPLPMRPRRIMSVDAMPLDSNGKIDRRALVSLNPEQTSTTEGEA